MHVKDFSDLWRGYKEFININYITYTTLKKVIGYSKLKDFLMSYSSNNLSKRFENLT